jgi:F-type H+-transporting ATPase subunit a
MADPVLHIKDSYFFEVPKGLWGAKGVLGPKYDSVLEVPEFLRKAHPEASAADWNKALAGKILIPQPFGTLKNLYEKESGFAISKYMILEVVAAILLYFVFKRFADRISSKEPPQGRFDNGLETLVLFVRDGIARKAIHHHPDHFVPILGTMFFFILTLNLFGLIPWLGSPTAAFGVTSALALIVLCTSLMAGTKEFGPVGMWTNMVPHIDMPWWLWPLKILIQLMLLVIESIGLLVKHGVLGVRLLANIVAGHLVLVAILAMIATAAGAAAHIYWTTTGIVILASVALSVLELGVAFLQAFVFTFLSALFINMASHAH